MIKIVINTCFGGFSLSELAQKELRIDTSYPDISRDDSKLVEVVERLGEKSWGLCAQLRIVEIPDNIKWHISEYDGLEHIAEDHRTWS